MEQERQGTSNKHKSHRSRLKAGYYKQQHFVTARNKNKRTIKRKRRADNGVKQAQQPILGGSAILAAKQHRRKTRNIQRQNRYKQQKAAAEIVLPVTESTAE